MTNRHFLKPIAYFYIQICTSPKGLLCEMSSGVVLSSCFGFTGLYAFAGKSNAYFDKKSYIVIALAPVIIFGLLFLMLNILLSKDLFWIIYIIQIVNLSGAIWDYYRLFTIF